MTVIEPESVRDKLYEIACDMAGKYATAVSEAELLKGGKDYMEERA